MAVLLYYRRTPLHNGEGPDAKKSPGGGSGSYRVAGAVEFVRFHGGHRTLRRL